MKTPTALFFWITILLFSCSKEDPIDPIPVDQEFTVTVDKDILEAFYGDVIVLSNQFGEVKLEAFVDSLDIEESLKLTVPKSPEEKMAISFIRETVNLQVPDDKSFHNHTFVNLQDGAKIAFEPEELPLNEPRTLTNVSFSGVNTLEDLKIGMDFYYNTEDLYMELNNGVLSFSYYHLPADYVFFLIKANGESSYRYFYSEFFQPELNLELEDLSQNVSEVNLQLPSEARWRGSVYAVKDEKKNAVLLQSSGSHASSGRN